MSCREEMQRGDVPGRLFVCGLPEGHGGPHKDRSGTEWRDRISMAEWARGFNDFTRPEERGPQDGHDQEVSGPRPAPTMILAEPYSTPGQGANGRHVTSRTSGPGDSPLLASGLPPREHYVIGVDFARGTDASVTLTELRGDGGVIKWKVDEQAVSLGATAGKRPDVEAEPRRSLQTTRSAMGEVDQPKRCTVGEALAPGVPNTETGPDGQQKGYVILCAEERAKGFVRPVRRTYRHVGIRPTYETRLLTPGEKERYDDHEDPNERFVAWEAFPASMLPRTGRYWTQKELQSGCGTTTTMGTSLAETYARMPAFYNATMCVTCRAHFPVGKDGEFIWVTDDHRDMTDRVGT